MYFVSENKLQDPQLEDNFHLIQTHILLPFCRDQVNTLSKMLLWIYSLQSYPHLLPQFQVDPLIRLRLLQPFHSKFIVFDSLYYSPNQ